MDDQATMNGRAESPTAGVRRTLAELGHDLLTLGELQFQLLAVDLREGRTQCLVSLVLLAAAGLTVLGAVPVLLCGVGWLLVHGGGLSVGGALLTVAAGALVAAAVAGWGAWRMLRSAAGVLTRSRTELRENLQAIKRTLKGGRTDADRAAPENSGGNAACAPPAVIKDRFEEQQP